jgi:hypothetical protein
MGALGRPLGQRGATLLLAARREQLRDGRPVAQSGGPVAHRRSHVLGHGTGTCGCAELHRWFA